ncbi:MAG: SGNH/GDSL hydrolase family protein [Fusicatenibacter sp.]|nr:SGNH/GDSL hydrolase family protein [Fusicatenibacter sp.]
MELQGKKIAFLGDSITEGVGTSSVEHVYWKVVERLSGANCYGYGISGTRIAPQRMPSEEPSFDRYFDSRVDDMIPDADVIVVFGGTNDFGHGDAAFGTMDDRTGETFYGALHLLLLHLINRYPTAQLVVMTPLHRCSEDENSYNEWGIPRQGKLLRYVDAICEAAAFYGIPVVDLYRTCSIQPRVPVLMERYMPDGLHPNDAGNELIAKRLLGVLKTL